MTQRLRGLHFLKLFVSRNVNLIVVKMLSVADIYVYKHIHARNEYDALISKYTYIL